MESRVCLMVLLFGVVQADFQQKYESILQEIIVNRSYNRKVIPRINTEDPVTLDFSFYFGGINEVNEVEEKFVTTAYLTVSWFDKRLAWSSLNQTEILRIYIPQGDVWKPDIVLKNGFKKFSEMGGDFYYMEIEGNGRVVWYPYDVFETRCVLDTRFFPFDRQQCNITFVVWSHTSDDVTIEKSEDGIILQKGSEHHAVWKIESVNHWIETNKRESSITFMFDIKRKPTYYVINIILPVILLGLLNCLVFIIPAESGEKTGFSVTIILSMVVFLTIVNDNLPTSSEYTCFLACYMLVHIILDVIILLLTTLQLRLNYREDGHPMTKIYVRLAMISRRRSRIGCTNNVALVDKRSGAKHEEHTEDSKRKASDIMTVLESSNKKVLVEESQEKRSFEERILEIQKEYALTWTEVVAGIDFIAFLGSLLTYFLVTTLYFALVVIQY